MCPVRFHIHQGSDFPRVHLGQTIASIQTRFEEPTVKEWLFLVLMKRIRWYSTLKRTQSITVPGEVSHYCFSKFKCFPSVLNCLEKKRPLKALHPKTRSKRVQGILSMCETFFFFIQRSANTHASSTYKVLQSDKRSFFSLNYIRNRRSNEGPYPLTN